MTTPLNPSIPEGLCQCGCGETTFVPLWCNASRNEVAGVPLPFRQGHNLRRNLAGDDGVPPFELDGSPCKLIPLTQGQFAIVDAADYVWLCKVKWQAHWNPHTKSFYAQRTNREGIKRHNEFMHRLILGLGKGDERQADHIDAHNTLDNRRKNLRIATNGQNQHNQRIPANNTSGFKGVSFHTASNRFLAYITIDRKRICLGYRATAEAAYELRLAGAAKYHKEFSRAS